jgi:hypothetical protein
VKVTTSTAPQPEALSSLEKVRLLSERGITKPAAFDPRELLARITQLEAETARLALEIAELRQTNARRLVAKDTERSRNLSRAQKALHRDPVFHADRVRQLAEARKKISSAPTRKKMSLSAMRRWAELDLAKSNL